MSLLTLPDKGYTYLSIGGNFGRYDKNTYITWSSGLSGNHNAQFWVDIELDENRYQPAIWWKFWKPTITFKVFACGGTVDSFYQTVKVQEK